ncbi:MAG: ECF-type sigma factor [Archangium sp.]
MVNEEIDTSPVTQLLREARAGDSNAGSRAYELIYKRLHDAARIQLVKSGSGPATLTPTALVSEAWLKLAAAKFEINDREHFLAVASKAMRQIVVDTARARLSGKRGGDQVRVTLLDDIPTDDSNLDVLRLEDALQKLEKLDARLGQVVQYRYFAGLTEEEIARLLGVTDRTVRRDWRKARAFLHAELAS